MQSEEKYFLKALISLLYKGSDPRRINGKVGHMASAAVLVKRLRNTVGNDINIVMDFCVNQSAN